MKKDKIRLCKNKDCQKILPDGYKYKYCEACRNKQAHTGKNILKGIAACAVAVITVSAGIVKKSLKK